MDVVAQLSVSASLTSIRGYQALNVVFTAPPGQWSIYLQRAEGLVLNGENTTRVTLASEKSSRRNLNLSVPFYFNGTSRVPYLSVDCLLTVETVSGTTSIAVGGDGWSISSTNG